MPRNGISFDQVAAVADVMLAEGDNPTNKSVRERLGTGSGNTIHRHLSMWREARPQLATTSAELPGNILKAIIQEIDRARSEARAEIEDRLVVVQAEAAELAATGEALEADLDKVVEERSALTTNRDRLLGQLQEQTTEIQRLSRENERERYSAEQARIEVAQTRNKLDMQAEKLLELSTSIDTLTAANFTESQARIISEKEVAVLVAKLASEQERSSALLQENEALNTLLEAERQSGENVRIKAGIQAASLAQKISAIEELSGFYEIEKNERIAAEKKIEVLATRLEEQGKAAFQEHQPGPTE